MPFHLNHAHLYKQPDLADAELLLCVEGTGQQDTPGVILLRMPAHAAILSSSPFFKAQAQRWQNKRGRGSKPKDDSPHQLVATLQHAEQQPAAEAILQAMYGVQTLEQLLSELPQEQQLHAALLADMWQLPELSAEATQLLQAAAKESSLSAEAVKQLLQMPAYPDCFQPLLKAALLSRFGDLEAVWADAGLRKELKQLPLAALEALLSCDELKVASEDTVLYAAQSYVNQLPEDQQQAAKQRLAPLIRCQNLSLYWLTAATCSEAAPDLLLGSLMPQLKQLMMLRGAGLADSANAHQLKKLTSLLPDAPDSWFLGQRASKQVSSVQVVWELGLDELKEAAQRSARERQAINLDCPLVTPPLRGLEWGIDCYCYWDAAAGGSTVGLFTYPANAVAGTFCSWSMTISVAGGPRNSMDTPLLKAGTSKGWFDFFNTGPMAGGWDEAAWAAKGLPTSGKLVITGIVTGVNCKQWLRRVQ